MSDLSASEYLSRQQELEDEARKLMPWDPKSCTYEKGALRQQVFACRSHGIIGICYSCSIQCHTKCDIVELFTKRHFTCDCGTERDKIDNENGFKCQLRKNTEADIPSLQNTYNHNFEGLFCSCNKEYDPDSNAVMLQCVLGTECNEDWYHDHCIVGLAEDKKVVKNSKEEESLVEGMPPLDTFDAYICWKCVSKYEQYFKRLMSHPLSERIFAHKITRQAAERELSLDNAKKRPLEAAEATQGDYSLLLKEDYTEQLKKLKSSLDKDNDKLYIFLNDLVPFLLEDEPVYEEPEEVEPSADELIKQLLQNAVERDHAAAGITAFHAMKSRLSEYLKPFAEKGRVVKEEDINSFFKKDKKN